MSERMGEMENLNYDEWRKWVNKTYKGRPLLSVFIKLLDAWNDDHTALCAKLDEAKAFHPRAMKLIEKGKPFLVVAWDEPYFQQVYSLIRDNEMSRGTWTDYDQMRYEKFLRKLEATNE